MGGLGRISEVVSSRMRLHFPADPVAALALGAHEFVVELQAQPKAWRGAEVSAEAQIVFGGAATAAFLHVGEVGRGNAGHTGDFGLRDIPFVQGFAKRLGKKVHQGKEVFLAFHGLQW